MARSPQRRDRSIRASQPTGRHEHTGPQVICKRCKGTGKRAGAIGKTDEERAFGNRLLYEMERATSNAEQNMKNRLHNPL